MKAIVLSTAPAYYLFWFLAICSFIWFILTACYCKMMPAGVIADDPGPSVSSDYAIVKVSGGIWALFVAGISIIVVLVWATLAALAIFYL